MHFNLLLYIIFALITIVVIGFLLGPVVKYAQVNNEPGQLDLSLAELDAFVRAREDANPDIKPDNHAHILWADGMRRTDCALVYLHGFSASHGEGYPLIQNFADRYQCNAYLGRLAYHGVKDPDAFASLTPESLVESAKEAIAIGKLLGERVILMSTSTGSTLSVYLAANDPEIDSLIMMSPNFDTYDPKMKMLTWPWGKQLFRAMVGSDYREWDHPDPRVVDYWSTRNRIEGYIALRDLMNQTMTEEIFNKIDIPYFVGYYYKNEQEFDDVISIPAITAFNARTGTPADQKVVTAFNTATGHVIGSEYQNPNWRDVQDAIYEFTEAKLGLSPVNRQ